MRAPPFAIFRAARTAFEPVTKSMPAVYLDLACGFPKLPESGGMKCIPLFATFYVADFASKLEKLQGAQSILRNG